MDLNRVNALAGKQLKAWREKLGLSTRTVRDMSRQIATQASERGVLSFA